ncbi:MAG: thiol reductant ABC exporter subunit CydD [Beutenbergiaceae bacterium]
MARPLDPALLREVASARSTILVTSVLVLAQTAAVVAAALLLARILGPLVTGTARLDQLSGSLRLLAVTFGVRASLAVAIEWRAHRGATRVITEMRQRVLRHVLALGPRWVEAHRSEITTLVTRGLDAFEPFVVRYLPQLLQAAILTPAILVVMASQDLLAAVTIAAVIGLIPLFMWLIGLATQQATDRRLAAQQLLNGRVLDLVAGLATLRAFGRAGGTVGRVRELADAERRSTMGTLRIAFLSGAVLELLATLSVALVAVGVGLRLVAGQFDLVTGLAVLILAPEVLTPIRMVGTHFHASADGVAATTRCLEILREPIVAPGTRPIGTVDEVAWESLTVTSDGRRRGAPRELSGRVRRNAITVLCGPSGSGKTTAALALLGLVAPTGGRVRLRAGDRWHDLTDIQPGSWRGQVAWVPQRPVIEPGRLRDLLDAPEDRIAAAAASTGFASVVAGLPHGWDTVVGGQGFGLSAGQRQRLALTRALLRPAGFLVLDEPTAHLDSASGTRIAALVRDAADTGRGVLILTHHQELVDLADELLTLSASPVLR